MSERTTTMTPDEIQAKREKHHREQENGCVECYQLWPCDAIQALDAYEELLRFVGNRAESADDQICVQGGKP